MSSGTLTIDAKGTVGPAIVPLGKGAKAGAALFRPAKPPAPSSPPADDPGMPPQALDALVRRHKDTAREKKGAIEKWGLDFALEFGRPPTKAERTAGVGALAAEHAASRAAYEALKLELKQYRAAGQRKRAAAAGAEAGAEDGAGADAGGAATTQEASLVSVSPLEALRDFEQQQQRAQQQQQTPQQSQQQQQQQQSAHEPHRPHAAARKAVRAAETTAQLETKTAAEAAGAGAGSPARAGSEPPAREAAREKATPPAEAAACDPAPTSATAATAPALTRVPARTLAATPATAPELAAPADKAARKAAATELEGACKAAAVDAMSTNAGLGSDAIGRVFDAFDMDRSGHLDVFELAAAVADLTGEQPSTRRVAALVASAAAAATASPRQARASSPPPLPDKLSRAQFEEVVRGLKAGLESGGAGLPRDGVDNVDAVEPLGEGCYEHAFPLEALGFRVGRHRGGLVVSAVTDAALEGVLGVGDALREVNGAPLGSVSSGKALARRVKPLRRPVVIAFERAAAAAAAAAGSGQGEGGAAGGGGAAAAAGGGGGVNGDEDAAAGVGLLETPAKAAPAAAGREVAGGADGVDFAGAGQRKGGEDRCSDRVQAAVRLQAAQRAKAARVQLDGLREVKEVKREGGGVRQGRHSQHPTIL